MIASAADERTILCCRWLGLLAHAVDEACWSVSTFVTEVSVIDTPIPLGDVSQHVASARLVWTPFVPTVAIVPPILRKIATCNLALAAFWRAVGCLDAAFFLTLRACCARRAILQTDLLRYAMCHHGHVALLPCGEVLGACQRDVVPSSEHIYGSKMFAATTPQERVRFKATTLMTA
eukprot:COSAG02_NODE_9343_length_2250_cov_7.527662_2_plen_177_part_00